jgi:hypothetical protein
LGKSEISKLPAKDLSLAADYKDGFQFTGLTGDRIRFFSTAFIAPEQSMSVVVSVVETSLPDWCFPQRVHQLSAAGSDAFMVRFILYASASVPDSVRRTVIEIGVIFLDDHPLHATSPRFWSRGAIKTSLSDGYTGPESPLFTPQVSCSGALWLPFP